jgi:hypothetical protein
VFTAFDGLQNVQGDRVIVVVISEHIEELAASAACVMVGNGVSREMEGFES